MINLRLDLWDAPKHAQVLMKELGITYKHSTPQSIGDCWWFWDCKNVPEILPDYLEILLITPTDAIGYGLSKETAQWILGE